MIFTIRQSYRKCTHASGAKNVVLISGTVQKLQQCKAQIPLGSTRLDTFDVSSPCILAVSS